MIPVLAAVGPDRTKLVDIPDFVDVLGQRFTFEVVNDHETALGRTDEANGTAVGMSHLLRGYIAIRGGAEQGEDCLRDTVLHEVIHCVNHLAGLDLDEATVAPLATALLQVLRSNPDLVTALLAP